MIRKLLLWRPLLVVLSVAFTGLALWLTLRTANFHQVWDSFGRMSVWPFVLGLVGLCLGTLARAARFYVLMREVRADFMAALEMIIIGYFFTTILPLRTGELVRIGYFARRAGAPALSVTSAAVVERSLDLITLSLLGAVFLSGLVGRQFEDLPIPPWFLGSLAGACVVLAIVAGFYARRRLRSAAAGLQGKIGRALDQILGGLLSLGSLRSVAEAMALSLALWLLVSLSITLSFRSLDLAVPFSDGAVVMLGTCFAIALPSTPGFIGTYHLGFVGGAMLVGIPRAVALPIAVIFHLVIQVPFLPIGGLILYTGGRKLLARPPADTLDADP